MWNFVSENKFKAKDQKDLIKLGGSIASYPLKNKEYTPISGVSQNFMNSHKYKMKSLDYQSLMAPKTETKGIDLLKSPEKNPFDFKGFFEKPKEDDRFSSFYQYNAQGKTYFDDMAANFQVEVGTMNDLTARVLNNESGIDLEDVDGKTSAYNSFLNMWQNVKKFNPLQTNSRSNSPNKSNLSMAVEVKPFRNTYQSPTHKGKEISPIKNSNDSETMNDNSFLSAKEFPEEESEEEDKNRKNKKDSSFARYVIPTDNQITSYNKKGARKADDDDNDIIQKATRLDFMSSENALKTAIFLLDLTNNTTQTKYYNAFKNFDENKGNITADDVFMIKTFLNSVLDNKIVPRKNLAKQLRKDFLNMKESMNEAITSSKDK